MSSTDQLPNGTQTLGQSGGLEASCADALVGMLPGPALMAQLHAGGPIPAEQLAAGLTVTYVGSHSADFALILLDQSEIAAAAGDVARVRLGDVVRPALERAAEQIGGGLLGEATEGVSPTLFTSPDAVVFDLVGESGVSGWFAVLVRRVAGRAELGDVTSRLGRINDVEMTLAVEIGRATVSVRELLGARPGTVIELDRAVGSSADVFLNGRIIAHGEIVVIDQQFGVRITEVVDEGAEG